MLHIPFVVVLSILFLLLAPGSVQAGQWCAHTAQELHDDLIAAANSADANSTIRIRQGVYDANSLIAPWFFMNQAGSGRTLEISGGWSGVTGLCQTQDPNPALTTLIGAPTHNALSVQDYSQSGNTLRVNGLTLRNPSYTDLSTACLNVRIGAGNTGVFERLRLEQCGSGSGFSTSASVINYGDLSMRDVAVRDGMAAANGGISVGSYGDGIARLAQISVTAVHSTNASVSVNGIALNTFDNGVIHFGNSVSWGNDAATGGHDLYLGGSNIHLTRVHYGTLGGLAPVSNVAPGTGDPGFVAAGDAHLRSDSILIDSGIANPEGGIGSHDADGHARLQGAGVDVGAYESTPPDSIFFDGFEQTM